MQTSDYPPGVLEKLQECETELLRVVSELCEKHNLVYFIDSGTCLGAVRHGGFIPWDDDIDIGMPFEDYVRFLELAPKHLPSGYTLHSCENTPNFTALWTKVYIDGTRFEDDNAVEAGAYQGIFLDIFPYFQVDQNWFRGKLQLRGTEFWQKLSYLKGFAHPHVPSQIRFRWILQGIFNVIHFLLKLVPQRFIFKWFCKTAKPRVASHSWYCAPGFGQLPMDESTLFPTKEIDFAGLRVQAPANVEVYLRALYGDYMTLPPVSERHNHVPEILDFGDGVNVMDSKF